MPHQQETFAEIGRRIFALTCRACERQWESPIPQGICSRCGAVCRAEEAKP